jgi:formylglycine-generating enzyme required for sulfatase activity
MRRHPVGALTLAFALGAGVGGAGSEESSTASFGQLVTINPSDGLEYVSVPAGLFQMGCSPEDAYCEADEYPRRAVVISQGFSIGRTEVTVGAFKRFTESTGREMPREPEFMGAPLNPEWTDDQQPIVGVTWGDARAYCEWAGGRLPSEAEWEYAARAGEMGSRYGPLNDIGWSADNSGFKEVDSRELWLRDAGSDAGVYQQLLRAHGQGVRRVAQKRPNEWGLFDTLGNVYEWTQDWYRPDAYRTVAATDPIQKSSTPYRVTRGGSWGNVRDYLRLSARSFSAPDQGFAHIGFRCVLANLD